MITNETPNKSIKETGASCEGLSSGRCPIAQQGESGHQHVTAGRRTWTNRENRLVVECFYLREPEKLGYRKRMHTLWREKEGFFVTEQRLLDQKRLVFERQWLSHVELEEIRRSSDNNFDLSVFEDNDEEEQWLLGFDEDGNDVYGPREVIAGPENGDQQERLDIEEEPQEVEEAIHLEEGVEVHDEEMKVLEKIKEILKEYRIDRLSSLKIIEKSRLMKTVKIGDNVIKARNITETNKLIYTGAFVGSDMVGMIRPKTEKKDPWWKRRLEGQVKQMQKDIGFINKLIEKKTVKKKWRKVLEVKYEIHKKKLKMVQEEIRQKIIAKQQKIKRYQNRINNFNKIEHLRTAKVDSIKASKMMNSIKRVKFQMQKRLRSSGKEFVEKKKNIIKMQNGS